MNVHLSVQRSSYHILKLCSDASGTRADLLCITCPDNIQEWYCSQRGQWSLIWSKNYIILWRTWGVAVRSLCLMARTINAASNPSYRCLGPLWIIRSLAWLAGHTLISECTHISSVIRMHSVHVTDILLTSKRVNGWRTLQSIWAYFCLLLSVLFESIYFYWAYNKMLNIQLLRCKLV